MSRKVVIDTDPGVDDALAIFLALASPELDIVGLTTIFGNAPTDVTTRNALSLLEIANRKEIPVSKGATQPIASNYLGAVTHVHGEDGQGNSHIDMPESSPIEAKAVDFIYERASAEADGLTILALGPLTNLALALEKYPDLPGLVEEVVVMGGNALCPGNATPASEANVLNDPEAADRVFGAAWRVTMIGLDVTHEVNLRRADLRAIFSKSTPEANHLAAAIPFYQSFFENTNHIDGIFSHDPTAVAYLLNNDLFALQHWPLRVETEGFSRGKTWPSLGDTDDSAPAAWRNRPKVSIATSVDSAAVVKLILDRL